jgi:ribosome-associated protein
VNKTATAVQLRFNAAGSASLSERVRRRVLILAGRRRTSEGEIVIVARRFRSRERNRSDAVERLVALIRRAAVKQKPRRPTKPSKAARRERLETKTRRSTVKKLRRPPTDHD